jgi:hypothetical protein
MGRGEGGVNREAGTERVRRRELFELLEEKAIVAFYKQFSVALNHADIAV